MKSALIDLHSLVTIWAPDLSDECHAFLQRKFPLFIRRGETVPSAPDIVLSPLRYRVSASLNERYVQALYGFGVFDLDGKAAVGVLNRGTPDILVVPSFPIKVLYRARRGVTGRLYGLLLFAIQLCLRRKNAVLVHGTVAIRGEQALMVSGHRGTRKTQLLLTFIRHGWEYLSDDKFILQGGMAYLFESGIHVTEHQYSQLPWLEQFLPRSLPQRAARLFRAPLTTLAYKYLRGRLPPTILRLLDPRLHELSALSFDVVLRRQARPLSACLLTNGQQTAIQAISRQEAVSYLTGINQLLFTDIGAMEQMLGLYTGIDCQPLPVVLARNLPDIPFHRLTSSEHTSVEEIYEAILTCCEVR